jgi:D-beta-D-heptose 7-phosphate kinase/D-beta-D-heptose 1-phosphate adenosyltransferase
MISVPKTTWDTLGRLRALVIGDAMLDSYLCGASHRLCQESPVPIVDVERQSHMPGGAANCAVNLASLGLQPMLLGMMGGDPEGSQLRDLLQQAGVGVEHLLARPERRTLLKTRIVCDEHLVVRFDQGTTSATSPEAQQAILRSLDDLFPKSDVVIVSDYAYGVITPAVIDRLALLQQSSPRLLVVDAKSLEAYRRVRMTACKPNYRQARTLLDLSDASPPSGRWEMLWRRGQQLIDLTGSRIVAVTLDSDGALVFERDQPPYRTYAQAAPQNRTAGAGDTFLTAFAAALATGLSSPAAAEFASAAAAVVVAKAHTAACSREELKKQLAGGQQLQDSLRSLLPILEEYRQKKRRIVLTSGCFDILHRGHITYLRQARQLGDVLVVGVNSDDSIRRLKGRGRPINRLADRMSMLAALADVDHVVAFEEDTPHRLIESVRPHVFVKGGDYSRATLPEADLVERLGGTVTIIPFVFDRSTSRIIHRICRAYGGRPETATPLEQGKNHDDHGLAVCPAPAVH